ncbi:flagellar assembly protein FliW [Methylococcus sp. EFPC2]|uniref:flagellar assembly protein FliW n=1 Tax=Methylococcus sp. EFPC2 TaxID=2812648 RepID=UPI0019689133|nr:flagellar assembly protein FliW [Methylococcus sp. EFPC2]QSA96064.1 flagellar assembly protein FliW [Methylococcus sp. EFPC2]
MLIKSALFGELNVDPSTTIEFPVGLPGFEDTHRYKLFHQEGDKPLVYWLQALDNPDVAFSVADPTEFGIHYDFTLSDSETELLGEGAAADILVLILLYKDEGGSGPIRGSIKSPLVINTKSRQGLQKQLVDIEPSVIVREKVGTIEFKAH